MYKPLLKRAAALPLLAVFILPMAACQAPINRGMDSVHQPVVSRSDYVFDVYPTPGGDLPASERERLDGWFTSIDLTYGDRVSIDGESSTAARASVSQLLGNYGLLLSDTAPATAGSVPGGAIRVIVSRSTASVPGCPDWRSTQEGDLIGGTSSNYGCATNGNLAAMIANPQDLVLGQPGAISRAPTAATKAIKTYQDKASTGAGDLKTLTGGSN
ncbi:CpaD family pilus assembly protein [Rhizorhapis suberifaciens]|uniref:Pilus assembly protein CpaD n=1 Tax=Rhizorhapis suberifaciens TaxID=13656 RepID=A0A840HXE6_9SPHN|nr:CpaD family pilus assembly protein [Rhizorhapis suberifaciens]MBB4642126.1 pilus assembly protein CpaD [Rhizorhapis suberifaciens]